MYGTKLQVGLHLVFLLHFESEPNCDHLNFRIVCAMYLCSLVARRKNEFSRQPKGVMAVTPSSRCAQYSRCISSVIASFYQLPVFDVVSFVCMCALNFSMTWRKARTVSIDYNLVMFWMQFVQLNNHNEYWWIAASLLCAVWKPIEIPTKQNGNEDRTKRCHRQRLKLVNKESAFPISKS